MTPVTPNQTSLGPEQLVEAGGAQASLPMPPSPEGGSLPPCECSILYGYKMRMLSSICYENHESYYIMPS